MGHWDWNPGVSVGETVLGAALAPDRLGMRVERLPPSSEDADWETYRIGDLDDERRAGRPVRVRAAAAAAPGPPDAKPDAP